MVAQGTVHIPFHSARVCRPCDPSERNVPSLAVGVDSRLAVTFAKPLFDSFCQFDVLLSLSLLFPCVSLQLFGWLFFVLPLVSAS